MERATFVVVTVLAIAASCLADQRPAPTGVPQVSPTSMSTRDAATVSTGGYGPDPGVAILIGTQASRGGMNGYTFRARPVTGCDHYSWREFNKKGEFSIADVGLVHVCSYAISNGSMAQDVQFISGTPISSGSGDFCAVESEGVGGAITGRIHLAPNQFISQGIGIGSLFWTDPKSRGLCLKVFDKGDVSISLTYAILE
jgi:hypothetical protein